MSTDIKHSKAVISKIIQSGRSFGSWLGNLEKKVLTNIAIARDNLPGLVSNLTSNAMNKFERKLSGKRAVRTGKWRYFEWRYEWCYLNHKIIRRFGCINW